MTLTFVSYVRVWHHITNGPACCARISRSNLADASREAHDKDAARTFHVYSPRYHGWERQFKPKDKCLDSLLRCSVDAKHVDSSVETILRIGEFQNTVASVALKDRRNFAP